MASESVVNQSGESRQVILREGDVVLDREEVKWVRKALIHGLASFAELEKALGLIQTCKEHDLKVSEVSLDWHPRHPTGATAETMGEFATALAVTQ